MTVAILIFVWFIALAWYFHTDQDASHFDEHGHPVYGAELLNLTDEARGEWKDAA